MTKHSYYYCYIITYQNSSLLYFTYSGTLQIHNAVYIPLDADKSELCICSKDDQTVYLQIWEVCDV